MTMKTRTIVEDVSGSPNRRYYAEVEVGDEVRVTRHGDSVAEAARRAVSSLRHYACDAERKFVESGVNMLPESSSSTRLWDCDKVMEMIRDAKNAAALDRAARRDPLPASVVEALDLLESLADGSAQIRR